MEHRSSNNLGRDNSTRRLHAQQSTWVESGAEVMLKHVNVRHSNLGPIGLPITKKVA